MCVTYLNYINISSKPQWFGGFLWGRGGLVEVWGFFGGVLFFGVFFFEGCSCKGKILTKNDQAAVIVTVGEEEGRERLNTM